MPPVKKINKKLIFLTKERFHPGKFEQKKPTKRQPKCALKPDKPIMKTGSFIPLHRQTLDAFMFFTFHSKTFIERRKYIEEQSEVIRKIKIQKLKVDVTDLEKRFRNNISWMNFEQKIRFAFLRLISLWRQKKYTNRILNTEDPITLSVPVEPIYLFDSRAKGYFVFEAKTLKKSMESNLFFNDWLFPEPMIPKNILTNLQFSGGQLVKIISEFRKYGIGSWGIESFRNCEFDIIKFRDINYVPLKIEGLKSLLRNRSSTEFKSLLREFVEDQYDRLDDINTVNIDSIIWAIENEPTLSYIEKWINLFEKYYTLDIICGGSFSGLNKLKIELINLKAYNLLHEKEEINKLFNRKRRALSKNIRETSSQASSIEPSESLGIDSSISPITILDIPVGNILIPLVSLATPILTSIDVEDEEIIIYGDA
jgi:hypothetical protein